MNNDRILAFALAALAVITLGAYALHTFPPIGGENLGVLAGTMRDPHLLTAPAWDHILQACGVKNSCMQLPNAAALALFAAVCALLALRARGPLAAALAGTLILTTPLALSVTLDPLGGEVALALALFCVAAADVCSIVTLRSPVRTLVAFAVALQDPVLAPACVAYAAVVRSRDRTPLLPLGGALVAVAVILAVLKGGPFRSGLDPLAGPLTFIVFAALFFGVLPALAFAAKRGAFRRASPQGSMLRSAAFVALAAAAGGVFAPTGDPAPYFIAGALVFGFALLKATPRPLSLSATPFAAGVCLALLALQIAGWKFALAEPTMVTARHTEALRAALGRKTPLCLVMPPGVAPHALAHGALFSVYGSGAAQVQSRRTAEACVRGIAPPANLIAFSDFGMVEYGEPGFALAVAAAHAGGRDVSAMRAFVTPATHVDLPGGHGAFPATAVTALRPIPEIVVTAGYSYVVDCTGIRGGTLTFAASNPIAGGAPVHYSVTERSSTGSTLLNERDVARTEGGSDWQYVSVPLQPACRSLTFASRTTTSEGTGAWVAFAGPSIRPAR